MGDQSRPPRAAFLPERKLVVDSLIAEVVLKHKEVAVVLTPPLAGLGFLSTSLAPKEEKRKVPEL